MDILTKIVNAKRVRIAAAKAAYPLAQLRADYRNERAPGRFCAALQRADSINIIAEIKKASPSKGIIRADFDPVAIAREYQAAGAAAISVLTEEDFFHGSLDILRAVRETVELPLLRKDFIIDEYQVYEAACAGADAFLLIAALLSPEEIIRLIKIGGELGLDALVEVHTGEELATVLNCQPAIIGVNNRNLKTFAVDLKTSLELARTVSGRAVLVSESGINSIEHIAQLRAAGYQAFLIGEQLMRASSPAAALTALLKPKN